MESRTEWCKSSYSSSGGNCVELSVRPTVTGIRDSKNPDGGMLDLPTRSWAALLLLIKRR